MNDEYGPAPDIEHTPKGELAAALSKAQAEYPSLKRTRQVKVTLRTGGSYSYKYAPLDECFDCVRKPFAKYGLSWTQEYLENPLRIKTVLHHSSGETRESVLPIQTMNEAKKPGEEPTLKSEQELGSSMTYMRRYSFVALVGLAAEEDTDGPPGNSQSYEHSAARSRGQDASGEGAAPPPAKKGGPSQNQLKRLFAIAKEHGWTTEELKGDLMVRYGVEHTTDLTIAQYNELCGDKRTNTPGLLETLRREAPTDTPASDEPEPSSPENPGTDAGGDDAYVAMAEKIMAAKERGDAAALRKLLLEAGAIPGLTDEHKDALAQLFEEAMNGSSSD